MKTVSLVGAASYLPRRVVDNAFFQDGATSGDHVMFRGVKQRHHVSRDETAEVMIVQAARKLADRLNLNLQKDVDILMTNVTTPDQPFTGCGADVGKALGCRPDWILDLHNGGCVSFISHDRPGPGADDLPRGEDGAVVQRAERGGPAVRQRRDPQAEAGPHPRRRLRRGLPGRLERSRRSRRSCSATTASTPATWPSSAHDGSAVVGAEPGLRLRGLHRGQARADHGPGQPHRAGGDSRSVPPASCRTSEIGTLITNQPNRPVPAQLARGAAGAGGAAGLDVRAARQPVRRRPAHLPRRGHRQRAAEGRTPTSCSAGSPTPATSPPRPSSTGKRRSPGTIQPGQG